MKLLRYLLMSLMLINCGKKADVLVDSHQSIEAGLTHKEKISIYDSRDKTTSWFRDGVEIMTQQFNSDKASGWVAITPLGTNDKPELLSLSISSGKITYISDQNSEQCRFSMTDITGDGIFDLILISDQKTKKLIEAYSIMGHVVEPVPSVILRTEDPPKLMEDEPTIHRYLRSKIREAEQAAPRNR